MRAMPLLIKESAHEGQFPMLYGPVQNLLGKGSYQILVQEERRFYVMMDFGTMARGQAAANVEVGPQRGQPCHPARAGERGAFSSVEFGSIMGLPSSRHIAFKHAVGPTVSGQESDFNPWTRDGRIYAKTVVIV